MAGVAGMVANAVTEPIIAAQALVKRYGTVEAIRRRSA